MYFWGVVWGSEGFCILYGAQEIARLISVPLALRDDMLLDDVPGTGVTGTIGLSQCRPLAVLAKQQLPNPWPLAPQQVSETRDALLPPHIFGKFFTGSVQTGSE